MFCPSSIRFMVSLGTCVPKFTAFKGHLEVPQDQKRAPDYAKMTKFHWNRIITRKVLIIKIWYFDQLLIMALQTRVQKFIIFECHLEVAQEHNRAPELVVRERALKEGTNFKRTISSYWKKFTWTSFDYTFLNCRKKSRLIVGDLASFSLLQSYAILSYIWEMKFFFI